MPNEILRDPFRTGMDVFQTLRNEMDRVIQQMSQTGLARLAGQGELGTIIPATDIIEDGNAYRITLDLPGIDPKEVEVNQSGNLLAIRAERHTEQEQRGRNSILTERRHGTVRREFQIPEGVDRNRISADFRNGLLTLTLPRSQEARDQSRRIEIKSA